MPAFVRRHGSGVVAPYGSPGLRSWLGCKLERAFAERGIQSTCAGRDQWDEHFLIARRGVHRVVVPPHARQQMLGELMPSTTLIDVVELMLDALDAGAP